MLISRFKPNLDFIEIIKPLFSRKKANNFEREFSKKFKLKYSLAFPYGRSALWAFFKSMNLKNKEIILPAYTCSVIAHAIKISGNVPVFLDVDLENFNFNTSILEKYINKKTAAVILTNTFGFSQNAKKAIQIIKKKERKYKNRIFLIQDCCHSFDSAYDKEKITKYGDFVLFSFNISKTITTIFGGIACFRDYKIYNKVLKFRDRNFEEKNFIDKIYLYIYLILVYIFFSKFFYQITFFLTKNISLFENLVTKYHLDNKIHFPKNFKKKFGKLEAAVGITQLKKYDEIIKKKKNISKVYYNCLKNFKSLKVPKYNNNNTYSHFPVIVKNKRKIIKKFKQFNIEAGEVIQYSIPHLAAYKKKIKKRYDNSKFLSKNIINIPNYTFIDLKILKKIFNS